MRVKSFQLVPGCVLLNDITGKSNKPIIPEKTVLTDEHISIIHKFLVETVDVSERLSDGKPFQPDITTKEQNTDGHLPPAKFEEHYIQTVNHYKKLFNKWQNNAALDIPSVREALIPFFETVDEIGSSVFTLHQYASKNEFIYHHSVSLGILSAFLAKKMGYEKGEWLQIGLAGSLSDCGMAKMAEATVMQNSPLNVTELEMIKQHPAYSYRMIEKAPALTSAVKLAVLQHHERLDGSGYPLGLAEEKIHHYARIITVCDVYYKMAYEGLYTKKESPFNAIRKLQNDQYAKLDHHVVHVFMDSLINYMAGKKVRLSTNQTGKIVFVEKKYPTRPIVKLDESGEILPLRNHPAIYVDHVM